PLEGRLGDLGDRKQMQLAQLLPQRLLRSGVRLAETPSDRLVVRVVREASDRLVEELLRSSIASRRRYRIHHQEVLHPLVRLDHLLLPRLHATSVYKEGRLGIRPVRAPNTPAFSWISDEPPRSG